MLYISSCCFIKFLERHWFFTYMTEDTYESLCDNRIERCWDQEGLYSHIQDTSDRLCSRIGMDRRDDEMPRQ